MTSGTLTPPLPTVCCSAAAYAVLRVPVREVPPLRQKPHPTLAQALPANLLKHADDQTVVGLAAVYQAIADYDLDPAGFADWGAVSVPRFLGRATMVDALQRFAQEGAWGISPHLIPHRSLHAPSGTLSQALKIHGPNLGVGGGPNAAAEGLLVAGALLASEPLPGLWLVLTCVEDDAVFTAAQPTCAAVALALVRERGGPLELEIAPWETIAPDEEDGPATFRMETLVAALTDGRVAGGGWRVAGEEGSIPATRHPSPATWEWRLACGGRLRLTRNVVREEKCS